MKMVRERKGRKQSSGKDRHRKGGRPGTRVFSRYTSVANLGAIQVLKDKPQFKYKSQFEWVANDRKKEKPINLIVRIYCMAIRPA